MTINGPSPEARGCAFGLFYAQDHHEKREPSDVILRYSEGSSHGCKGHFAREWDLTISTGSFGVPQDDNSPLSCGHVRRTAFGKGGIAIHFCRARFVIICAEPHIE